MRGILAKDGEDLGQVELRCEGISVEVKNCQTDLKTAIEAGENVVSGETLGEFNRHIHIARRLAPAAKLIAIITPGSRRDLFDCGRPFCLAVAGESGFLCL